MTIHIALVVHSSFNLSNNNEFVFCEIFVNHFVRNYISFADIHSIMSKLNSSIPFLLWRYFIAKYIWNMIHYSSEILKFVWNIFVTTESLWNFNVALSSLYSHQPSVSWLNTVTFEFNSKVELLSCSLWSRDIRSYVGSFSSQNFPCSVLPAIKVWGVFGEVPTKTTKIVGGASAVSSSSPLLMAYLQSNMLSKSFETLSSIIRIGALFSLIWVIWQTKHATNICYEYAQMKSHIFTISILPLVHTSSTYWIHPQASNAFGTY